MSMTDQSETHPGAVVNPSDAARVRRDTIAEVYRAIMRAQTAGECRDLVAQLGNAGAAR